MARRQLCLPELGEASRTMCFSLNERFRFIEALQGQRFCEVQSCEALTLYGLGSVQGGWEVFLQDVVYQLQAKAELPSGAGCHLLR